MDFKKIIALIAVFAMVLSLTACSAGEMNTVSSIISGRSGTEQSSSAAESAAVSSETGIVSGLSEISSENAAPAVSSGSTEASQASATEQETEITEQSDVMSSQSSEDTAAAANVTSTGAIDASDMFTDRDLAQTADLTDAVYYTVNSGEDISITEEGVYVLSGSASEVSVIVDAESEDKVQIVLDGVSVTNSSTPCIYVKNADKVFITTTSSENSLAVEGTFTADGETNTDAVIFSRDDLVLNGTGVLNINSTDNGISSKDDIKITGGTYVISCVSDAVEVNDMISVSGGVISIVTEGDGFKAENDEDETQGMIYICGGTISISAGDDGMHAACILQTDGGNITVDAAEGLEATWVQINGGDISISAADDGINASDKSGAYAISFEMNGGYVYINMGAGDTDAVDSNGTLYINGGTLDIYGQSPFDYDYGAEYNGGTIIVNGNETNSITNQFGGMRGGPGGMEGGSFGQPSGEGWNGGSFGPSSGRGWN